MVNGQRLRHFEEEAQVQLHGQLALRQGRSTIALAFRFIETYYKPTLFIIVLFILWEIASPLLKVPDYLLPAPSAIFSTTLSNKAILLKHTMTTLNEIIIGFIMAVALSILLAIGVCYSRFLKDVIYPLAIFTQTVPKLAIAPLFIVWFGFDIMPKIVITALIGFFPILINAVVGLTTVDERLLKLLDSVSASKWDVFRKVRLPNSSPYLFAGFKTAITFCVIGAIVGEWVGADRGLGYLILIANSQLKTRLLFAAIFAISILGILLFLLIILLELAISPRSSKATAKEVTL